MKVTYDIPERSKYALEEIKAKLRRQGLRGVFERAIIAFLIDEASLPRLAQHFTAVPRARGRTMRSAR
ncbi:MAG TPA: hypothetical protein VFO25_08085 [Candidatus Eremiobacteraceae bacterium]|nr:hypothetical protein [Candidatus Eremiobacteraceae bacterium]